MEQELIHFELARRFKGYTEYRLKRKPEITILHFDLPDGKVYIPEDFNFTMEEWDEMEALEMAKSS